jgi:hypothetical protein
MKSFKEYLIEVEQGVALTPDQVVKQAQQGVAFTPAQLVKQAQQAGNAIRQLTPQFMKGAANDVRRLKGQDPTKLPGFEKLSPQKQQEYLQAQEIINSADADELEKIDANQAASDIEGLAKSFPDVNNMPDLPALKSNIVPRKTAADFLPPRSGPDDAHWNEIDRIKKLSGV